MRAYDDLLAVSLDPAAWDANAERVHALGAARGAAAVDLRKVLGLGGGSCTINRPERAPVGSLLTGSAG